MPDNLLTSLLTYRPRPGRSSKEDFLTEAFAHLLRTSEEARRVVLAPIDAEAAAAGEVEIQTQERFSVRDAGRTVVADMTCRAAGKDGAPHLLLFEHKWGSGADGRQLSRYGRLAGVPEGALVVFIGATARQRREARETADVALTWGRVHERLKGAELSSEYATTFVEFMEEQGLTMPDPITREKLEAYAWGRSLPNDCKRLAQKLAERDWQDVLPERIGCEASVNARWGRIGLLFNWDPGVFLGFLMDGRDHRLELLRPELGPDIMMCLDTGKTRRPDFAENDRFRKKAAELRRVVEASYPTAEVAGPSRLKNEYRQLVLRVPLASVLEDVRDGDGPAGVEERQVDALHALFSKWARALFEDGELERALDEIYGPGGEPQE